MTSQQIGKGLIMINHNFKQEWKTYDNEVYVLMAKHFDLSIDKACFGIDVDFSSRYRLVYIKILCLALRLYF